MAGVEYISDLLVWRLMLSYLIVSNEGQALDLEYN